MDEKYQRIRVLGKGAFGKAYLVRNTEANALCVVKQIETSAMDPKERNEAVKEAMLLKRMDHPNIVRFQEVFMTRKGRLCIVMDYADGGDVHQEIKRQGGNLLCEALILEWFVQVSFALRHVHSKKVLHRDLKTQNIFLMESGQIKLGDFGIARVLQFTKDYARTMVGTPYYLSPEIINDRPYSYSSDVWSLGVILYEMTTLKHPFDAESLVVLAGKILKDEYPPPDAMYSPELVGLIAEMLNKDAVRRPGLTEVLQRYFLQDAQYESNTKYDLGLDLSPFAPPAPAPDPAPEVGARPTALSPGAQAAAAMSAIGTAAMLGMVEREETDVSGTIGEPRGAVQVAEEDAAGEGRPEEEQDEGGDEYEDEFEDYSGSENGDEPPKNELQQSIARLRLDGSDKSGAAASGGPSAAAPSQELAPGPVGGTTIAQKAEKLGEYLQAQMPEDAFEYALGLAANNVSGEELTSLAMELPDGPEQDAAKRLSEVKELLTMFQLLIVLQDVSFTGAVRG